MNDMFDLKEKLKVILDHIEDKNDVIFLDYPLYYNIGDILIFNGTLNFFKSNSIDVKLNLSVTNTCLYELKKHITNKTTLIFQGGGNFGDIYDVHQKLRERIVERFPNNKIIILPQTAFFNSQENLENSKKIFRSHSNVIMFARDRATYNMFKDFSEYAYLVPDMAHELYGKLPKSVKKNNSTLFFLRKDVEINPVQLVICKDIDLDKIIDWEDLISDKDKIVLSIIYKLLRFNRFLKSSFIDNLIFKIWVNYTNILVAKFSKVFSSYEKVLTSRLHGHILACLVDTESQIIDNSYGKNSAYYSIWTGNLKNTSILEK